MYPVPGAEAIALLENGIVLILRLGIVFMLSPTVRLGDAEPLISIHDRAPYPELHSLGWIATPPTKRSKSKSQNTSNLVSSPSNSSSSSSISSSSSGSQSSTILAATPIRPDIVCNAILPWTGRTAPLTHADLLLLTGIYRSPTYWTITPKRLCRLWRKKRALAVVEAGIRTSLRRRRGAYEFEDIPSPFYDTAMLAPSKISKIRQPTKLRHRLAKNLEIICKQEINLGYLQNKLSDPSLSMVVARRRVPIWPSECVAPTCHRTMKGECIKPPLGYYFRHVPESKLLVGDVATFNEFKRLLQQKYPDPKDRTEAVCGLPRRPIIGGFALIRDEPRSLTVFILCSNRALGKAILDHLKTRGKRIYIDEPLDKIRDFYYATGFKDVSRALMVWNPPTATVSVSESITHKL